jgi:hypothetical protein
MNQLNELYQFRKGKTKRISSYDGTGGNDDRISIKAGETVVLADIPGTGIIKHIWLTVNAQDPMYRRNMILRMYWDGEQSPSVQSPLGEFFGQGWGESYSYASLPLAAAPKDGRGLNCYFPMPFAQGAKITLENDSDFDVKAFYYYFDYEEHDAIPPDAGRFHAWWNREITLPAEDSENEWGLLGEVPKNTSDVENYLIADIEGKGHFVGVNYYVDNPGTMWYGEGDDMWMIDGESWPGSLHGTGTEDFFNSAWCPNEVYTHPYFGYPKVPDKFGWMGRTHCYRFMIEDPIHFDKSLRSTIEHGHANVLTLDIATVAYWYQSEPHKPFPAVPVRESRQNLPEITPRNVHVWRDAWRKSMGGGLLWGQEREK